VLSKDKSCSVTAATLRLHSDCEVVVCEAHCVAGSVISPVDPSLHHSEVCGHTAGPVWPTTATSPLPLPGWDDSCREQGKRNE